MSEFKVGDKIVYHSLPHQRLFYVKASLSDSIVVRECLDEAGMKLIDRILIVRRALLIAINPNVDGVFIKRLGKDGRVYKNLIWTDREKAVDFYKRDMIDLFTEKAKNADNLAHLVNVYIQWVQEDWNKMHPNDKVQFFAEKGASHE
ncbi:hypothetical protein ACT4Y6_16935 [Acinetobacter baumannii]|uniref:hypothetical protein n=1 Tax=Acinetobacter baumannii TaxID=470 RepID=UPI0010577A52|nr:hypothetical protein [Acinetobacter baumannii]MDV4221815.1 hypothetical protein [Acinetobacter baumannii]QBM38143.1 hypothetical protein E1A85_13890 [Acinetobacter baumannii]